MPPLPTNHRELFTLHLVPGIGPRLLNALVEQFGSPGAVLRASAEQLGRVPHIGPKLARQFRDALDRIDIEAEFALLEKHGVRLLAKADAEYPEMLTSLAVPPPFLYVRGRLLERDRKAVAIIGSRQCSSYGLRVAQRLAFDLARAGFTIVSGLARGIDGAAHRAALDAGGRTIAVLAGGLGRIYPPEHTELAEKIQANGALLTESPIDMEPMAGMFPPRNRIISGLSRGIILVEAADKSGALITATHAAEQGREIFAIPGPVDSVTSAGALRLLRQGARLVRNAADVIEDLDGVAPIIEPTQPPSMPEDLDEMQARIWTFLTERRSVDQLAQGLNLSIADLSRNLMVLELKSVIRRLPGNLYERK